MKRIIFIAALLPTLAYAQVPPMPSSQPAEYNLKVAPQELELISEGLGTQPFNKVLPLINKLRQQVMEQQPKPPMTKNNVDKPSETK